VGSRRPGRLRRRQAPANRTSRPALRFILASAPAQVKDACRKLDRLRAELFPAERQRIVKLLAEEVVVTPKGLLVRLRMLVLACWRMEAGARLSARRAAASTSRCSWGVSKKNIFMGIWTATSSPPSARARALPAVRQVAVVGLVLSLSKGGRPAKAWPGRRPCDEVLDENSLSSCKICLTSSSCSIT